MINNILKKIEKANEIQEVKLEKHEVELALVDDFNKLTTSFFNQTGKFETSVQKIETAISEMQKQFIETQKISSSIDSDYQKVRKSAQELGVNVPTEIENNYKKVLAILKNDLSTFNKYNK